MIKRDFGIDVEFDKEMNDPKVYKLWQEVSEVKGFDEEEKDEKELRKQQKVIADLIQKQESFQPQFETKLKIIEKYRQEQHPVCIRNLYELTLKLIQTKEKALK